ncbi:MAG: acyl-CoA dehydrogenase family protein, partial [Desulfobacterales bacterium]
MNLFVPGPLQEELNRFDDFLEASLRPQQRDWEKRNRVPRRFFETLAEAGWLGASWDGARLVPRSALRETLLLERMAARSPGIAATFLIVSSLGLTGLARYGGPSLTTALGADAAAGSCLICLGNTENIAGSDAAGIAMTADKVADGWLLNGTKAYVTNGLISDYGVVTAVTDPEENRSKRLSMFLVNLRGKGVARRRLNKRVWIPSDLTRIEFKDVAVPSNHLMGERGRGLQQLLSLFTHSRVAISGLALGNARGAFEMALNRLERRRVFGRPLSDCQAKAFEAAHHRARLEAAKLAVLCAAHTLDKGGDYRLEASCAKYLAVEAAQSISLWAADLFGAASVMESHPIYSFPLDAWGVSLAEGTQDVQ